MLIPQADWASQRDKQIELPVSRSAAEFLESLLANLMAGMPAVAEAQRRGKVEIGADGMLHLPAITALPDQAEPVRTRETCRPGRSAPTGRLCEFGDLHWVDLEPHRAAHAAPDAIRGGWVIEVVGKGRRRQAVPVPGDLVHELTQLIALRGWPGGMQSNLLQPMLVAWASITPANATRSAKVLPAQSDRGAARKLNQVFREAALALSDRGRPRDADAVRRASVHWIRHTHGAHSIEVGVPLDLVQQGLRHASLATTTVYVMAQMGRRLREARRLVRDLAP